MPDVFKDHWSLNKDPLYNKCNSCSLSFSSASMLKSLFLYTLHFPECLWTPIGLYVSVETLHICDDILLKKRLWRSLGLFIIIRHLIKGFCYVSISIHYYYHTALIRFLLIKHHPNFSCSSRLRVPGLKNWGYLCLHGSTTYQIYQVKIQYLEVYNY